MAKNLTFLTPQNIKGDSTCVLLFLYLIFVFLNVDHCFLQRVLIARNKDIPSSRCRQYFIAPFTDFVTCNERDEKWVSRNRQPVSRRNRPVKKCPSDQTGWFVAVEVAVLAKVFVKGMDLVVHFNNTRSVKDRLRWVTDKTNCKRSLRLSFHWNLTMVKYN